MQMFQTKHNIVERRKSENHKNNNLIFTKWLPQQLREQVFFQAAFRKQSFLHKDYTISLQSTQPELIKSTNLTKILKEQQP